MLILESLPGAVTAIGLYLAQHFTPAMLIITTQQKSPLRYLWIPCSVIITYLYLSIDRLSKGPGCYQLAAGHIFVTIFQTMNLLLVNPVDKDTMTQHGLLSSSASFHRRTWSMVWLFLGPRGVKTPWQAKGVLAHPVFFNAPCPGNNNIPSSWYLVRQTVISMWEFLVLNVFAVAVAQSQGSLRVSKPSFDVGYLFGTSLEQWFTRVCAMLCTFFVPILFGGDLMYRIMSLGSVGFGYTSPEDWPPLFGSISDAYTLKNFWCKYWHQLLRWPFTSISSFLTRDVLGLPIRSILARHMSNFLVFMLSGALHVVTDSTLGIPPRQSGAIFFFFFAPLGLVIEAVVQALWRWLMRAKYADSWLPGSQNLTPLWQRILGFVWVFSWMTITVQWWLFPLQPFVNEDMPSLSIPALVGMRVAVVAVVGGGLLLKFLLGAGV